MSFLLTILLLSVIIIIHEFGHYYAAIKSGVQVQRFCIGFGPTIYSKVIKQTRYELNLLPLGGAVVLAGLDDGGKIKVSKNRRYDNKSWLARFKILSAGTFMNILLGFVIFVLVYSVIGIPRSISNTIGVVLDDSPAASAGLLAGDKLAAVNRVQSDSIEELVKIIHKTMPGQAVNIKIDRAGTMIYKKLKPKFSKEMGVSTIGIILKPTGYQRVNIFKAVYYGLVETFGFMALFLAGITRMFLKLDFQNVAGPVGIINISSKALQYGLLTFLRFFAILSIQIGLLNLLPLPALDGGRLVFLFIEGLRGRPVDKNLEKYVHLIGFMLLLSLLFFVTYQDIQRLIR